MASLMPDSITNQLMTDEAIVPKITAETVLFLCLLPFVTKVLISCWKVEQHDQVLPHMDHLSF